MLHCQICGLQKLVFVGLDVHTVRYLHDECTGHAGDRSKYGARDDDPTWWNSQLNVTQEAIWSLSKLREESASVFVHLAVESRYRFRVHELVK